MSSHTSQDINSGTSHLLRAKAYDYEPLLHVPEKFTFWDTELSREEFTELIQQLTRNGAVRTVGQATTTKHADDPNTKTSQHIVNKYQWKQKAKAKVKDALEHEETLPCGHRPHIKNHGDGTYGCRYCDEERHYSRETIENRL